MEAIITPSSTSGQDQWTHSLCDNGYIGETQHYIMGIRIYGFKYFMYFRPPGSNSLKWFKFDDGDVSEAKLDDEEVHMVACWSCSSICPVLIPYYV